MSEEEVNWSHLPHSPELFFGCEENATRRDLKRSYNKILKTFKPEQFPDEFKKIRKAFEDLDAQISYGLKSNNTFSDFSEPASDLLETTSNKPEEDSDFFGFDESEVFKDIEFQDPFAEVNENPHEDLEELFSLNGNVQEILDKLESKSSKNSADIILEALIKETQSKDFSLFDYLIEAYSNEKENSHLKSFLFQFLRTRTISSEIDSCLKKVAQNVDASDFYYLTETLWFKLADEKGLDFCCSKIAEIENLIGYIPPESLSVFYLHFCTRFVFELEDKFLVEKMDLIEDSSSDFYWREESESIFLSHLYDYRQSLDKYLTNSPHRQHIHKIIETWCKTEESLKHRAFINEAVNLDLKAMLDSSAFTDPSIQPCSEVIEVICAEINEDNWEEELYDEEEKCKKIRAFMLKIEEDTDRSTLGSVNTATILSNFAFHLAVVLVPGIYGYNYLWTFFSESLQQSTWRYLIVVGILVGLGALYFFFGFLHVQNKFDKISDSVARRLYNKVWRCEVIQFLKQNPINFNELHSELIYMEDTSGITNNGDMYNCMSKDYTLRIFSSIHSLQF